MAGDPSLNTFARALWGLPVAIAATVPVLVQGCLLLTCYEGDTGCTQGSAGVGGGGNGGAGTATATSSTTGGGGSATTSGGSGGGDGGGGGSGHCVDDCWGGECKADGECGPVALVTPFNDIGRIAATETRLYLVHGATDVLATILRYNLADYNPLNPLTATDFQEKVISAAMASLTDGYLAAVGDTALFSPKGVNDIVRLNFTSLAPVTIDPGDAVLGRPFRGLSILPNTPTDALLAVPRGDLTKGQVALPSRGEAVGDEGVVGTMNEPFGLQDPPLELDAKSGAYNVSGNQSGVIAWTLKGDYGCVAVGKIGLNSSGSCAAACLGDTTIAGATDIAVDQAGNIFFTARGTVGAEYGMYAAELLDLSVCLYGPAQRSLDLGPQATGEGLAVTANYVYVASSANGVQTLVRCARKAPLAQADCTPVHTERTADKMSLAANSKGAFFATKTTIGWIHD